jgi:hypothetical protein
MKRKAPYTVWWWDHYSKSKVTPELLQAVGHLSFLWNDVEEGLDRALAFALEVPVFLQVEVRSRINGLEGKVELIKAAVNTSERFTDTAKALLLKSIGAFMPLKERRDAVIHAKASEIAGGIARTFERRGAVYEVLLTVEALNIVNRHLEVYASEIDALSVIMGQHTPFGQVMLADFKKGIKGVAKELAEKLAIGDQIAFERLVKGQFERGKLPALPILKESQPVKVEKGKRGGR